MKSVASLLSNVVHPVYGLRSVGGELVFPAVAELYGHRRCLEAGAQHVLDHTQLVHVSDRWRVDETLLAAWMNEA